MKLGEPRKQISERQVSWQRRIVFILPIPDFSEETFDSLRSFAETTMRFALVPSIDTERERWPVCGAC